MIKDKEPRFKNIKKLKYVGAGVISIVIVLAIGAGIVKIGRSILDSIFEPVEAGYTSVYVYSLEDDGDRNLEGCHYGYDVKIEEKENYTIVTDEDEVSVYDDVILEINVER